MHTQSVTIYYLEFLLNFLLFKEKDQVYYKKN